MRSWWLIWSVMCVVGSAAGQVDKAEAQVRKALALDRPYRALTLTDRALTKKEARTIFHVLRAEAFNRIGEYAKAMQQLRQVGSAFSASMEYRTNLIGAYSGLGLLDSAMQWVQSPPPADASAEYLYRAGSVFSMQKRWTEALPFFQQGVSAYPASARLVRERGACSAMLGDTLNARMDLDRAVELAPREAVNYNSRGFFGYAYFGDHPRAIEEFSKAIKQDPNYGYAFSNRGWSRYRSGNIEKALNDLRAAVRKDPSNAFAHRSIGIILIGNGPMDEGCIHLHKALALGFTAMYGEEVQDLVTQHCAAATPPAPEPVIAPAPVLPPSNAPQVPPTRKGNAP